MGEHPDNHLPCPSPRIVPMPWLDMQGIASVTAAAPQRSVAIASGFTGWKQSPLARRPRKFLHRPAASA